MTTNVWCQLMGVQVPRLESVVDHPEANTFSLFLVALLEHGRPMTLVEVAERFELAGVAGRAAALLSLQRCKPGRPPVYREGDLYHLDPRDDDLDLWLFRLGLRPPKLARPALAPPSAAPLPGPDTALTTEELREAWKDANLWSWSVQRVVLAVLDSHRTPLAPESVVSFVAECTRWHKVAAQSAKFKHRGSAVTVLGDGRWAIATDAAPALEPVRKAVRDRIAMVRRHASYRPDPAAIEANRIERERQRALHASDLDKLARALIVLFPANEPQVAVLLDVAARSTQTFVAEQLDTLRETLANYDVIGGVEVRFALRALGFEPGERWLAELGPAQKSKQLNRRGRSLKITTALLVSGTCGISQPFGERDKLEAYLAMGSTTKLQRRLVADAKSLYALYQYGRLHGAVRLRWGFLDERIPAPWVHRDERTLYDLKISAFEMGVPLEIVLGSAPGWEDPWARVQSVRVMRDGYHYVLIDEAGYGVDDAGVQLARLSATLH